MTQVSLITISSGVSVVNLDVSTASFSSHHQRSAARLVGRRAQRPAVTSGPSDREVAGSSLVGAAKLHQLPLLRLLCFQRLPLAANVPRKMCHARAQFRAAREISADIHAERRQWHHAAAAIHILGKFAVDHATLHSHTIPLASPENARRPSALQATLCTLVES